MDPSAEQLDAEARAAADAAAAAAQAEVAREAAAAEADAKAAESASVLASIFQAIRESNDKIEAFGRKLDTVSSSLDGLNDRADKTDKRLKDQKAFFSGPGLISEHKEELKTLILDTMVEGKAELSMVSADFTADLNKVTEKRSTTDGRLSSLQSKFDQIQTSAARKPSGALNSSSTWMRTATPSKRDRPALLGPRAAGLKSLARTTTRNPSPKLESRWIRRPRRPPVARPLCPPRAPCCVDHPPAPRGLSR